MLYPNEFFWNFKSGVDYGFDATDRFSIDRCLRAQASWRKPHPASTIKKKTLILADWTAVNWSDEKIEQMNSLIQKLLADGFEIIAWQGDRTVPLKQSDEILGYAILYRMRPDIHETIINTTIKQNSKLTGDSVQILDDYWLKALLEQDFNQSRKIDSRDVKNDKLEQILPVLESAEPKLEAVIHTEFSAACNSLVNEMKSKLPVMILPLYQALLISSEQAAQLADKEEVSIDDISIRTKQLQDIKRLRISSDNENIITVKQLEKLFTHADNITTLELQSCKLSGEITTEMNLKSVEELNLSGIDISVQSLKHLLSGMEKIKKLEIIGGEISGIMTGGLNLESLEFLTLDEAVINADALQDILNSAKNLQELNLTKRCISGDFDNNLDLKSLKKIYLPISISAANLQCLLSHAESLEELDLMLCDISGEMTEDLDLSSLKSIKLPKTMSANNLQRILVNAKKLVGFDSASCKISGDITEDLNLRSLKSLTLLSYCNLSSESIMHILMHAENLEQLDLYWMRYAVLEIEKMLHLKSLKVLILPEKISAHCLQNIMAYPENIRQLKLYGITIPEQANMQSLDELELFSTTCNLGHLFKNAKKLRELILFDCEINNMADVDNFDSIQKITLQNMNNKMTADNMFQLLNKTGSLRILVLCNIELPGETMDILNIKSLELISILKGIISSGNIQNLLLHAENLKELWLCCEISGEITENVNLRSLEKFQASKISSRNFQQLLSNAESLKHLDFRCIRGEINITQPLNLISLESIHLPPKTVMTSETLHNILVNANNLQYLDLGECEITGQLSGNLNLKSLIDIKLPKYILAENLQCLLIHAEKLVNFNLNFCKIEGSLTEKIQLPSLNTIFSRMISYISSENFEYLFSSSNKLREVELQNMDEHMSFDIKLAMLEKLEINSPSGRIASITILNFLKYSQNLKKLVIKGYDPSEKIPGKINLPLLQSVELMGISMSVIDIHIYNLFSSAKNLQNLKITGSTIAENTPSMEFPSLKSLDLAYVNLPLGSLLSGRQGKLREIKMVSCYLTGKITDFISLPVLETLSFSDTEISEDQLKSLVFAASNLKKINLTRCPPISQAFKKQLQDKGIQILGTVSALPISPESTSLPIISDQRQPSATRADAITKVDANTTKVNCEYKLNQIFCGANENPHPRNYRLAVSDHLALEETAVPIDQAFNLVNQTDIRLTDKMNGINIIPVKSELDLSDKFKEQSKSNKNLYYGKLLLNLDSKWQALPSLSTQEKMLEYHLDHPLASCEIRYSQRDNLYYIRSASNKTYNVTMDFLLESHVNKIDRTANLSANLPDKLKQLIHFYHDEFGEGSHWLEGPATSQQYLDAINHDKSGACRHRSIALMDAIQNHKQEYGLPETLSCRYVSNDCHAFVEIQLAPDQGWVGYDLGGYPAKVSINKMNIPASLAENKITSSPDFTLQTDIAKPEDKYTLNWFRKKLASQKAKPIQADTNPRLYCEHVLNRGKQKQLIELTGTKAVQALALALENYCHHTKREVYYIHSPDDLCCSSAFVKKEGNQGLLTNGPGGELHDFLIKNRENKVHPPVLIVNYDNFAADDIVRLNSLLDKQPKADGTDIGETMVIGLINPAKPGCYKGKDFTSRFGIGNIQNCSFAAKDLISIPPIEDNKEKYAEVYPINLYHAEDWQERLLGRWQVKADGLCFQEGLLAAALQSGKPIEIQNGLWSDPSFCHFWDRARSLPQINAYGETFRLSTVTFTKSEGYDQDNLQKYVIFDDENKKDALVLNPGKLSEYFYRYRCQDKKLDTIKGLIEENHDKILDVNLTRSLSEDEWAELLTECAKYNVKLNCHCIECHPERLSARDPLLKHSESLSRGSFAEKRSGRQPIIESTDVDVTISQLTSNAPWKVIDVSELTGNDLLLHTTAKVIKGERPILEFTQKDAALNLALQNNEKIILKGRFSPELADSLAPILLQAPENLRLITTDAAYLKFTGVSTHAVTRDEKHAELSRQFSPAKIDALENFDKESFSQSRARLFCPQLLDPWKGLQGLSGDIRLSEFDENNSKKISDEFVKNRREAINTILASSPYVFITGITGVGKSTFIEKNLDIDRKHLYIGEDKIRDWVNDASSGRKILFIDEANITTREWSEFYGLFNDPPSILIDGEYQVLSKDHKVIFAGNPLNYGGERQMAPIFADNGMALVFEPLPSEFIYEEILKPILVDTKIDKKQFPDIAREILKIYRFLCECSKDEVLLSPRELEMMALMLISHAEDYPHDDMLMATRHYAWLIAKDNVPETYRKKFDELFSVPPLIKPIKNTENLQDFVLTPSREPLWQYMSDLVSLSEYRKNLWNTVRDKYQNNLNELPPEIDKKLFGGLGGIIIEGEPGIGKSEQITALLKSHKSKFHYMPVSMSVEDKKKMLSEVYDQGAFTMVDEINSAPMMERPMNSFLMNRKENAVRPENVGSMIFATQNPSVMAGRGQSSTAQKRRIPTVFVSDYPDDEKKTLLHAQDIDEKYIHLMIQAAEDTNSTTRALLDLAEILTKKMGKVDVKKPGSDIMQKSSYKNATNTHSIWKDKDDAHDKKEGQTPTEKPRNI